MKSTTIKFEELSACIGDKNALKLCRYFPGRKVPTALNVLRARRDAAMYKDYIDGAQIGELSAKWGLPKNVVKRKVRELMKEQMSINIQESK